MRLGAISIKGIGTTISQTDKELKLFKVNSSILGTLARENGMEKEHSLCSTCNNYPSKEISTKEISKAREKYSINKTS